VDNGHKDGKGTGDKDGPAKLDSIDDEREGGNGGHGNDDLIVLDPTPSPTTLPTILPTIPVASPTTHPTILPTIPVASPTKTAFTDAPSVTPSVTPSAPNIPTETSAPTDISATSSPSNLGTKVGTVNRNLLPFDITVQGEETELQMIQIPLELSVNDFLFEKMDDSFESFKSITLSTIELGIIQRQATRKSFGFSGDAIFYDINVPTSKEVQDVQQRFLSEFSFELQGILNDRDVPVNVVDVALEDAGSSDDDIKQQDGDNDNPDGGDESSANKPAAQGGIQLDSADEPSDSNPVAIGVAVGVAVVAFICALLAYLQQRKPKTEDNKEPELLDDPELVDDPDLDVDAPVDHMIDTSASRPI